MTEKTTCLDRLINIAAGDFDMQELKSILQQINSKREDGLKDIQNASAKGMKNLMQQMQDFGEELYRDAEFKLRQEKFHLLHELNIRATRNLQFDKYIERFKNRPVGDFIKALTNGIEKKIEGGRYSTYVQATAQEGRIMAKLWKEMDRAGALSLYNEDKSGLQILKAAGGELTGIESVDRAGGIVRRMIDNVEQGLNQRGIFFRKIENYFPVMHDKAKMLMSHDNWRDAWRERVQLFGNPNKHEILVTKARDRWKQYMLDKYLDHDETFGEGASDVKKDKFLNAAYDTLTDQKNIGRQGENIAQRMQHGRVLIPRSAEAQINYIMDYGSGSFKNNLEHFLRRSVINMAIVDNFGIKPYQTLEKIATGAFNRLKAAGTEFTKDNLANVVNKNKLILKTIDRSIYDNSSSAANVGRAFRNALNVLLSPGTITWGFTADLSPVVSQVARYNESYIKSLAEGYQYLGKIFTDRQGLKDIADVFDITKNSYIGAFNRNPSADEWRAFRGTFAFFNKISSALSGHAQMNYAKQTYIASAMGRILAKYSDLAFEELPGKIGSDMSLYGITGDMWHFIKQYPTKTPKVPELLALESADNLPDEAIRNYLKRTGVDPTNYTKGALDRVRNDISSRWSAFFDDQISHGVLSEDAAGANWWMFGHEPKTVAGQWGAEVLKLLHFYKSYMTAMTTKPLARMLYGEGVDTFFQALQRGSGFWSQFAKFGAVSTLLSMGAVGIKAAAFDQVPKSPEDFVARVIEGSGLIGLYSNFVNPDASTGADLMKSIVGPGINELFDAGAMLNKLAVSTDHVLTDRVDSPGGLTAKGTYHYIKRHIPFINAIYLKKGLDYLLFDNIEEMITGTNPHKTVRDL